MLWYRAGSFDTTPLRGAPFVRCRDEPEPDPDNIRPVEMEDGTRREGDVCVRPYYSGSEHDYLAHIETVCAPWASPPEIEDEVDNGAVYLLPLDYPPSARVALFVFIIKCLCRHHLLVDGLFHPHKKDRLTVTRRGICRS